MCIKLQTIELPLAKKVAGTATWPFLLTLAKTHHLIVVSKLVVVNSKIFGATLQSFFKKEGIKTNFLIKKKSYLLDLKTRLKSADTVITVCGCLRQLKGDMIKEGAILIDAGITLLSNGKVVGDIDKKSVEKKAAFLTPVPEGIGHLTVDYLLKKVYDAARNH